MDLKSLMTKRSSVKGQITKFKNYLSKITEQSHLPSIEVAELSLKIGKFEALSVKFDDLQGQIEVLNPENLAAEIDERDNIEQDLIICLAHAKGILDKNNVLKNVIEQERRASIFQEAQCSHDQHDSGVKLPQIQIAKFNGAYFRWLEFRDTFDSLIHKNERISAIQKFHYLISYLEGDAARVISNIEVSSDNYHDAWKLLTNRYNNKRLLINHHLKSLFSTQTQTRESDSALRYLVDHVTKNLRALASLGQPTDKWDTLIIYMISSKLDSRTLMKWEECRNEIDGDVPSLEQFYKFLIDRADVLESINRSKFDNPNYSKQSQSAPAAANTYKQYNNNTKSFATMNFDKPPVYACIICSQNHKIYDCPNFKRMTVDERLTEATKYKLCLNCLRQGHPTHECRLGPCRECKKRHNSLLHKQNNTNDTNVAVATASSSEIVNNFSKQNKNQIILSTAMIEVRDPITQQTERVRALLDCGSQSSFITKSLQKKLNLKTNTINLNVVGIGNTNADKVRESCVVQLKSTNSDYGVTLSCLVLNELTGDLPKTPIDIKKLNLPGDILLADPAFDQPAPIQVLIGADIFWDILKCQQKSLGPNNPKLQNSQFGWLIAGPILNSKVKQNNKINCNHARLANDSSKESEVENLLTKFWELEELPAKTLLSESEKLCEQHFASHVSRLNSGRFCVKLPLVDSPDSLGDSYHMAKKRLLNLEKRFKRDSNLKQEYSKFIKEYSDLGHLSESTIPQPDPSYFLCHHAVFKQDSESTKLRVVFDGSAATSSGFSVNDLQMVGPNVQDSLLSIILRARQYKYLLTGDIEKMYRQVLVNEEDRDLQLILWRDDESRPIKTLRLNTITYGTASASYLSTRCLWQIGEECGNEQIKTIIQKDFYVDDLITGCDDAEQLKFILNSVKSTLRKGCFKLRKFKTNLPSIFESTDLNTQENLTLSESSSTLGLGWNPSSDKLNFPTIIPNKNDKITKRSIMSASCKIFDPLGLLSPFVILSKMLLQTMWQQRLDWDQPVPNEIQTSWLELQNNMPLLSKIEIPRSVVCDSPILIEMHSFSDASLSGFGTCVYVRSISRNNEVTVRLLCAKSKVTSLKPTTVPRLELCAALLAARLCNTVKESIRYEFDRIIHWCDSTTVLAWLTGNPNKLKTFVANRVGEIVETTKPSSWRYVPTDQNPADLISRGASAAQLTKSSLWWNGPSFLTQDQSKWPSLNTSQVKFHDLPEVKATVSLVKPDTIIQIQNFSKLTKLQRTLAYVKRFLFNAKNPKDKRVGILSLDELNNAFYLLCAIAQEQSFPQEYKVLSKGQTISIKSRILPLTPFMDEQKLIRVGGRINDSDYTYEKKHPILLDSSHHLCKLIFEYEHVRNMHAGPQLLLATVRETVWPINGRHLARRTVHNCVLCRRAQGKTLLPKMGNLPSQRITPDFPFKSVGIDFAGPFHVLNRKGKGARLMKSYLCLFVCLRYKCLHLEAVSDLTKDAFIMTLRRFVARRGKPAEIFCDNGRNFVAAAKELASFLNSNTDSLSDFGVQEGFKFIFTPTYAPHFGGIWEAGVKSAKYHIKRIMANTHLTFEEISTLFAQVEAILNSRPLCPLSSSPNDFLSLSPGHFLIGRPLNALPSSALGDCKESQLNRYARVEKIRQHFWQRWQREYISELQQRTKWKTNKDTLHIGDLVLIHDEAAPPLCWRLGRILRLFPGSDGLSRVADVITTRGTYRRPLVRLCPLPSEQDLQG